MITPKEISAKLNIPLAEVDKSLDVLRAMGLIEKAQEEERSAELAALRLQIATSAMQGILANPHRNYIVAPASDIAVWAISQADSLLKAFGYVDEDKNDR